MASTPSGDGSGAIDRCRAIMEWFARSTGLEGDAAPRRYLWTDAFAVCNYLGLGEATGNARYLELAQRLVDQVHHVLGHHRPDDPRTGWISGLPEDEGARRPTAGGLRIGKPEPERSPGEAREPRREWDRDGQYYHYLTRWMHALLRTFDVTGRESLVRAAVELAQTAHDAFVHRERSERRMYWKMSVDLSRPLVPSMGAHDPLDGLLTLGALRAAAPAAARELDGPIAELGEMCRGRRWATDDPLGIGGLLTDAYRAARLAATGAPVDGAAGLATGELSGLLIGESLVGLRAFLGTHPLAAPAARRLPFRELGLAIGLAAIERLLRPGDAARRPEDARRAEPLEAYLPLKDRIAAFWVDPESRRARTWTEHLDINQVMLATTLAPDGYLGP